MHPLLPSIEASANMFRGSIHELPYTLHAAIYFHEYHRLPGPSTRLPYRSTDFHSIDFHMTFNPLHGNFHACKFLPWKLMDFHRSQLASMEASMEVVGVDQLPRKFQWSFVELNIRQASRRFHRSTWKFPLSVKVESSIASTNCNFLEYTPWKLP